MDKIRTILHCDLNSFYASVEIKLNPELKGKAVAVCGSAEDRHGIILAKSDLAKKAGVKTAEAIWQAKQKCPDLITIPPHYEEYIKYSKLARKIYEDYTDLIEPFGIDECWLDITGSMHLFGTGEEVANIIRERIKNELGITVSIGVSFNKVFAKLGSDLKKPDAVTLIPYESFKEKIWALSACEMIWVGNATYNELKKYGIFTIGDLANTDLEFIKSKFGKNGIGIWSNANGFDNAPVMPMNYTAPVKSVGHGITCIEDLTENEQVWRVFYSLSQDVARRLRKYKLSANAVQISVKDNELRIKQYQCQLPMTTQCFSEIAQCGMNLFYENWEWQKPVRAVTIRAINLVNSYDAVQTNFNLDFKFHEKNEKIELAIEKIRKKYGESIINMCSLKLDLKMAQSPCVHGIPTMYR